ncbi:MAG: AMP-binding protein, partial [Pseudomonadota bacterium]
APPAISITLVATNGPWLWNLLSNAEALVETWQFTQDDTLLHALPIFHSHGPFVATNVMLMAGGAMIFLPKFDADTVLSRLPDATTMMGVPTFYTRLLDEPRFAKDLVAHMRLFISGSAPYWNPLAMRAVASWQTACAVRFRSTSWARGRMRSGDASRTLFRGLSDIQGSV